MDIPIAAAVTLIGHIPVVVRLHPSDIVHDDPAPLTFSLPRTTLLLSILRDVRNHFARYTASFEVDPLRTQLWFAVKTHPYQQIDSLALLWLPQEASAVGARPSSSSSPSSSYSGDYPVSWLLPVGAIKDFAVEARRRAVWLQQHACSRPSAIRPPHNTAQDTTRDDLTGGDGAVEASLWPSPTYLATPPTDYESDTFDTFPLELYFHFHQCATPEEVQPSLPFYLQDDAIQSGRYLLEETRRLHKGAYTALYGNTGLLSKLPRDDAEVLVSFAHLGASGTSVDTALGLATTMAAATGGGDMDGSRASGVAGNHGAQSLAHSITEHCLGRYHALFVRFRKALQRGEQKNAYVAVSFPADALVVAICSTTHAEAKAAGTQGTVPIEEASAQSTATDATPSSTAMESATSPKKTKPGKSRSTLGSAAPTLIDIPASSSSSSTANASLVPWTITPALFETLVVPLNPASAPTEVLSLTFAQLVWRLFRPPCAARASAARLDTMGDGSTGPRSMRAPQTLMEVLLTAMTPYYYDKRDANQSCPTEVGEADGCASFASDYEHGPRGLRLSRWMADRWTPSASSSSTANRAVASLVERLSTSSRVLFMVQGTCPLPSTPLRFMEEYLTSSNRTLYITIKLMTEF